MNLHIVSFIAIVQERIKYLILFVIIASHISPVHDKVIPCAVQNEIDDHQCNKLSAKFNRHNGCVINVVNRNRIRYRHKAINMFIVTVQAPDARQFRGGECRAELHCCPQ